MDKSVLKNQVIEHFPEEIREEFEMPFFRIFHDFKIFDSRKIGAISNHKLDSVSVYTLEQDMQGKRPRVPINIVADGIHEHIHNFFNQRRYQVPGFNDKVDELNQSYNARKQAVSDTDETDRSKEILTYSHSGPIHPHEFTFKPETTGLERSVALTLKQDELIDVFSDFEENHGGDTDNSSNLERQIENEVEKSLESVKSHKIKQYLDPIRKMEYLINLDKAQNNRAEDEAMARFYVSATLPEYTQRRFENARTDITSHIGELSHENETFSRHHTKVINQEYGEDCASSFYRNTERYRDLIEDGYSPKKAADQILQEFLDNIDSIGW